MDALRDSVLFVFWCGEGSMTPTRAHALSVLKSLSGVHIELVTDATLTDWVIPDEPLHPAFPSLSATHKSDYLRSYFMYHYGGGYADIKPLTFDWRPHFSTLLVDTVDFYGAPECRPSDIAGTRDMMRHYGSFVSNGAFLFKRHSSFAQEWRTRVNGVLDTNLDRLERHPGTYHARATTWGAHDVGLRLWERIPRGYPLRWTQLQGQVFHQLQWERPHSYRPALPRLAFGDYR